MAEVSEKALAFVEKNKAQRRQRKNILRPLRSPVRKTKSDRTTPLMLSLFERLKSLITSCKEVTSGCNNKK